MKRLATILALLLPLTARAAYDPAFGDDIDRTADDFVTVSLVVADPGSVLYSRLGHAALHMQCPSFNLDYIYSYESENILEKPFSFLAGKTKMGMTAISYREYVGMLEEDHRGAVEYTLNIPIEKKRELWRELDSRLEEGMHLKYDFVARGCAHSSLVAIQKALGDTKIVFNKWPEKFHRCTRREIVSDFLSGDKWTRVLLHLLCGGIIDDNCLLQDKVILPSDLAYVLSNASVDGRKIIDTEPEIIIASENQKGDIIFSPVMAALLIFLLAVALCLTKCEVINYVLLGIQSLLGFFVTYLVFFSSLVCTEWSWLIIPFNPLPLIFWKWRRWWKLPYCGVLLVWCGFMIFWPHQLTDPAYIILTFTLALSYAPNSVKTIKK